MGSRRGDRRKGYVFQRAGRPAKGLQRFDRVDFGQLSARRFRVEPGQKPRHRRAVALMRGPRSRQFRLVLYGFHERDGILADLRLPARLLQGLRERGRRRGGVEEDARAFLAEPPDERLKVVRLEPFREFAETVPDSVRELSRSRETGPAAPRLERRRIRGAEAYASTSPPRMLNSHARLCGSVTSSPSTPARAALNALDLGCGAFAGKTSLMLRDDAQRRPWTILPDRIDRIGVERDQLAPAPCCMPRRIAPPNPAYEAAGRSQVCRQAEGFVRSIRSADHRSHVAVRTGTHPPASFACSV